MKRKLFVGALAVSIAFTTWMTDVAFATTSTSTHEKKLNELKKDKAKVQEQLKNSAAQKTKAQQELTALEKQISALDDEIDKQYQIFQANQKLLEVKEESFKATTRQMYQRGQMYYMVQLFQANNFNEFLIRFDILRTMMKREREQLDQYYKIKQTTLKAKSDLEAKKKVQQPLLKEAQEKYEKINSTYQAQKQQFNKIEAQEKLTKAQIAEIKAAASAKVGAYGTGDLMRPVIGGTFYKNFHQWRGDHYHEGVDFANSIGTPIYAADSGTVTLIKSDPGGYGNYIVINHGNGLATLYAHMTRSSIRVSVGDRVARGQRIASVGNEGRSTGPHLHFEVHKNGTPVNPVLYL